VTLFKILFATGDVNDEAYSTFLKEEFDKNKEKETQMDELSRGSQAFTWSDDESGSSSCNDAMKYNKNKKIKKTLLSPRKDAEKVVKQHLQQF
jgi:hypothetical protein